MRKIARWMAGVGLVPVLAVAFLIGCVLYALGLI